MYFVNGEGHVSYALSPCSSSYGKLVVCNLYGNVVAVLSNKPMCSRLVPPAYTLVTVNAHTIHITIDPKELEPAMRISGGPVPASRNQMVFHLPIFHIQCIRHGRHTPRAITPIIVLLLMLHTMTQYLIHRPPLRMHAHVDLRYSHVRCHPLKTRATIILRVCRHL